MTLLIRRISFPNFLNCLFIIWLLLSCGSVICADDASKDLQLAKEAEQQRIKVINKVMGSVIAIYGEDRNGGGSGVIIDPTGIALTNHHVIMGAGVKGWGGLADGQLYRWKLIGTDPGGDVSLIQMEGKDEFPFTPLGNSDDVRVGDWSIAMGNPFILTEDQKPTVTLGIVSGVKRYQPGAGQNQLVYGNCIQTDSSINPGNSGGPLFSMQGRVIGINGRGSFKARGRVNVGLGYAISANQIKNFIPDLLATKLVEHGTLDANFEDRNGKVLCANVYEDTPLYKKGLRPGDELLQFEDIDIKTANQFTNLICTLPEDWPASLKTKSKDGKTLEFNSRLFGLPYRQPDPIRNSKKEEDRTPEERRQIALREELINLLSAPPGKVREKNTNKKYTRLLLDRMVGEKKPETDVVRMIEIKDKILRDGKNTGSQYFRILTDGRFHVEATIKDEKHVFVFDGKQFSSLVSKKDQEPQAKLLSLTEAKLTLPIVQAAAIQSVNGVKFADNDGVFGLFGNSLLDGGGRVVSRNAYRFKTTDSEDDWFYFWCSMYDNNGDPEIELLKACADKDCDEYDGAITFHDWKMTEGFKIPHRRTNAMGLNEKPIVTYTSDSVEIKSDFDDSLFKIEIQESSK